MRHVDTVDLARRIPTASLTSSILVTRTIAAGQARQTSAPKIFVLELHMTRPLLLTIDGKTPAVDSTAFLAPTAAVSGDVVIAARASVFYGASVRGDMAPIRIGHDSNVQDNAVLHADPGAPCTLGARVTIGHGAVVHGCTVEDDCLIGMHATVMNHAVIGSGSLVAAGSVVLEGTRVPPRSLVAGTPGKVRRELTDEECSAMNRGAMDYVAQAQLHNEALRDTFTRTN
jgi:carbonic anhydrase/acetyltransferase-like protein (isoleucine patch superfamily)